MVTDNDRDNVTLREVLIEMVPVGEVDRVAAIVMTVTLPVREGEMLTDRLRETEFETVGVRHGEALEVRVVEVPLAHVVQPLVQAPFAVPCQQC